MAEEVHQGLKKLESGKKILGTEKYFFFKVVVVTDLPEKKPSRTRRIFS